MFGCNSSSCSKKLIKQVQCRLKRLKNRRCSMVRLLRSDIAELIKIGNEETAFNWLRENTVAVYELLDSFCELILMNLSFILECKDCPSDIDEAVSSLIFASSRCGDLPELYGIRKLFEDRCEILAIEYAPEYNVFTWVNEKIQVTTGKTKESYSPSKCISCLTGKGTAPPYLTVKTMPPERPKETRPDNILPCNSLPHHVHPKLPDYDHIVAKCMALKKELRGDQR
ncbi:hypothetical protein QYF36_022300 [Acer negundo]|nr:hypothetical protein QYF36_022300 [Acer negundo]